MFQVELLSSMSAGDDDLFLRETLKDLDEQPDMPNVLFTAWQAGDSEKIAGMMTDSLRKVPNTYEALLVDRNKSWIPKIEAMAAKHPTSMVVVGCGHLVGEDSVQVMLKNSGGTIRQLTK